MIRKGLLLGLILSTTLTAAAPGWAQAGASVRQFGRDSRLPSDSTQKRMTCPCVAEPFFQEFVEGQRPILACTNNTSFENFVRVVADNLDLIVLFEMPGQLYCGWQPVGYGTFYKPVSGVEFNFCKRLMVRAANLEGIPCPPEI